MSSYRDWVESFYGVGGSQESGESVSSGDSGWTPAGAARNLSQHVGPGMWSITRSKLEQLSQCGDPAAERIARDALSRQDQLYGRSEE